MANLLVKSLHLTNPFVIASSPATHGLHAVLKSARALPGAIAMRNFGHGAGGGSYTAPSGEAMRAGAPAIQSHGLGTRIQDPFPSFEAFCEGVAEARKRMPTEVKLWVSVGHYSDIVSGKAWEKDWTRQAIEMERAGADAVELHFNTPGVAVGRNRIFDYYRLVYNATRLIKQAVKIPVMVKLPVEACDPLRAMEAAVHAGAAAIGPTARWKAFVFDLDWRTTLARPGAGYGGTQALPIICYNVAEARQAGITTPMYAGGGVFSWDAAAKLLMAGSEAVQLGSLACCLGPDAVTEAIQGLERWMDRQGYPDSASLCGEALQLFNLPSAVAERRVKAVGRAFKQAEVTPARCTGCGKCVDSCWYQGISLINGKACKTQQCIGCGYCFQVCPTGALQVDTGSILTAATE